MAEEKEFQEGGIPSIRYMGSAVSHFQAEPIMYGPGGEPIVISDWELELAKNLRGEKSHVLFPQAGDTLPHFLEHKYEYINRSALLGENMFRISFDFARLCPNPGEFNGALMAQYVRTLALIRAKGMEPLVALYHWPMPHYLLTVDKKGGVTRGGWEHPDVLRHVEFYIRNVAAFLWKKDVVEKAIQSLDLAPDIKEKILTEGLVHFFITINEPASVLYPAYMLGIFPPFKKWRIDLVPTVLSRLVAAHDIMYGEIKKSVPAGSPEVLVGIGYSRPDFDGVFEKLLGFISDRIIRAFERSGIFTDFIGVQYYFRKSIPTVSRRARDYSDNPYFGDIYPEGLGNILRRMHSTYPKKKIFITEFGFSDTKDTRRPYWILESIRVVIKAMEAGVPISGMLHWSLVDNFEWNLGMEQKFGLFTEQELSTPPVRRENGIRSWEAWEAAIAALRNPSQTTLAALQSAYEKAR